MSGWVIFSRQERGFWNNADGWGADGWAPGGTPSWATVFPLEPTRLPCIGVPDVVALRVEDAPAIAPALGLPEDLHPGDEVLLEGPQAQGFPGVYRIESILTPDGLAVCAWDRLLVRRADWQGPLIEVLLEEVA